MGQRSFAQPPPPTGAILDAEWSPDGAYIAKVYANTLLEVMDTETNEVVLEFQLDETIELYEAKVAWNSDGT